MICSLKATAETVEAVKKANSIGAITIAMTGNMDTGMAKVGQYVVTYSNGDDQVYSDSNQANSLRIGFELLHQFEGWDKYDKAMEAYKHIDEIVAEGKENCLAAAKEWADKEKDEPVFYVLASGPNYGVAYSMCCCHFMEMQWKHAVCLHTGEYFHGPFETTDKKLPMILIMSEGRTYSMCCCHFMEMQWKHAVCLHTGEYFHGPFETTDKKLPMILIMSEGRTRALDERCLKFLNTYAENFIVIDFKELNKGRIDADVAEFFNPVVLIPIERYYVAQMAEVRGHSMDHRRYMWKVEY